MSNRALGMIACLMSLTGCSGHTAADGSGGAPSNGGTAGITTGGNSATGGTFSTGGSSVIQCSLLSEADCAASESAHGGCAQSFGSLYYDASGERLYAGCRKDVGCTARVNLRVPSK